jgi:Na+/H+ antiporter
VTELCSLMINLSPFIFIIAMLVCLSLLAGKIRTIPYPILLVLAGLVIGFIPGLPVIHLDPDVVLLLFLPPLLYRSACTTSWIDFKASIKPISRLAIGLVVFTTVAVAAATHYFIPAMGWAPCFVLGAIVSPPDAVAAASIIRSMGLNKRIATIIEGESLVNDASALVVYRYAVAAVVSSSFVLWKAGLQFLIVTAGGILIGVASGYLFCFILRKTRNNAMAQNSLSLLAPFITYPVAEHFEVSGVLAVVCAGLVTSWQSSYIFSYQGRTQSDAVWNMVTFLLNGVIFILIGLELSEIISNLQGFKLSALIFHGLMISLVAILVRLLFIAPAIFYPRLLGTKTHVAEQTFDWRNVLILSWAGMRGVVSIATAMALPFVNSAGKVFPNRNVILVLTFIILVVTLVGQGLSLPLLVRRLHVNATGKGRDNEEYQLRLLLLKSALDFINTHFSGKQVNKEVAEQVQQLYELRLAWLSGKYLSEKETAKQNPEGRTVLEQVIHAQLAATDFNRELLIKLYRDGIYSAETIRKLEKEMDLDELRLRSQLKLK